MHLRFALLLVTLSACTGAGTTLGNCACAATEVCIGDACRRICIDDADCAPSGACSGGVCSIEQCQSDSDCVLPRACEEGPGVCRKGACTYAPVAAGAECDDGDVCTATDACSESGLCIGSGTSCPAPPQDSCVTASVKRVYAPDVLCQAGECQLRSVDLSCPECPSCTQRCIIDHDQDGLPEAYVAGAPAPGDVCSICDPTRSTTTFSPRVCTQTATLCRASDGVCDGSRSTCDGDSCCMYTSTYGGSGPAPECPLPGQDDGNRVEDGGENWTGRCGVEGSCAACVDDSSCPGGACVCADAQCITRRCSSASCACRFDANGDGTCEGLLADGIDDRTDSCGVATCNGAGACRKPLGVDCGTNVDCASGHCVDGVCCNSTCTGSCERCDAPSQRGSCVADSALCGGNCSTCLDEGGVHQCRATVAACGGTCSTCTGSGTTFNCAANAMACTGNCDACTGSGTVFNCAADSGLCTGNCDTCSGGGTSFNCAAVDASCTGNCDTCSGSGTSFSCSAMDAACAGNCDTCSGSGTSFNCAANAAACTGNCDTCNGSGTNFNCAANSAACTGNCDECSELSATNFSCAANDALCTGGCGDCQGAATSYSCVAAPASCAACAQCDQQSSTSFVCAPAERIDAAVENVNGFTSTNLWQSFRTLGSGTLIGIDIYIRQTSTRSATLRIRDGEGPTGTQLRSASASVEPNDGPWFFLLVPGMPVTANQLLTWEAVGVDQLGYDTSNPYANGRSGPNAGWDFSMVVHIQEDCP